MSYRGALFYQLSNDVCFGLEKMLSSAASDASDDGSNCLRRNDFPSDTQKKLGKTFK